MNKTNLFQNTYSCLVCILAFFSFISQHTFAQNNCIDSSLIGSMPICVTLYDPVCGCDGITYSNDCFAQNAGITSWTSGACNDSINNAESCEDLTNVDFGVCDMFIGIGIVNGQCIGISGCDWIINGIDYSPAIYSSLDSCQACLSANLNKTNPLDLNLYPNPSTGIIHLAFTKQVQESVFILDITGRIVLIEKVHTKNLEIDLSQLNAGTYYIVAP